MTDPQRLADVIDPRLHQMWQNRVGLKAQDDLIAASDALRSSTTALEIGRAMGTEAAVRACDEYVAALKRDAETVKIETDTPDMSLENRAAIIKDFLARASAVRIAAHKIRAAQPMDAWRPIDEAPKDGTEILLLRRGGFQCVGVWHAGQWLALPHGEVDGITHWQPLPSTLGLTARQQEK